MDDADYVCTLDEKSLERARRDLNEDPNDRLEAVRALRAWIKQESEWLKSPTRSKRYASRLVKLLLDIPGLYRSESRASFGLTVFEFFRLINYVIYFSFTRTVGKGSEAKDTKFLLAFLRISKFSQLIARDRLVNFLASFNDSVSYLNGYDPADPKFIEILKSSRVFTPLRKKDEEGRTIIIGNYDKFDHTGNSYSYPDFQRSILGMCHSLVFCDEQFQVNGVNFIMDYGSITRKHLTFGGSEHMRNRAQHFQKALPVPLKQFHNYNTGPIFNVLLAILRPALPEKMKVRVFSHGHSMVSVYREVDKSFLPDEYLPDDHEGPSQGTLAENVEHNIQTLLLDPERREFIKDLWSGKYGADIEKRPVKDEGYGSFRKIGR